MSKSETSWVVSIDGPAASGKSTVARLTADALDALYVDSGALYRGVTWKALREWVPVHDVAQMTDMLAFLDLEYVRHGRALIFTLGGEDPGQQLRSAAVRERVSDVAVIPEVRAYVVDRLRELVRFGNLVMEGRDIGSVVFPETPFKFYLDADPEERARRRHEELVRAEGSSDVAAVQDALARRDRQDSTRATAPLQVPLGAQVINSTHLTAEQVAAVIVEAVRGKLDG